MAITNFVKAKRENVTVLVALAGASGSGKTFSAMTMADALSGDDPFIVIDTENRRALHYADHFDFEHCSLAAPFHPDRFLEAVRTASDRGFKAIVIDSMSHEWEGEGGVLQMAENQRGGNEAQKWLKPKQAHFRMLSGIIQTDVNVIFCLRAREKIKIIPSQSNPKKTVWQSVGYVPICEKGFMFELVLSFTLDPSNPGAIDLRLPNKVGDDFRSMFLHGQHVTRESCEKLAMWAKGGSIEHPNRELWRRARIAANEGMTSLREFVDKEITADEKTLLKPIGNELNRTAKEADKNKTMDEEHFDHRRADHLDMLDMQAQQEKEDKL